MIKDKVDLNKAFFLRVGSPRNAEALLSYLSSNNFSVYDFEMARETGSFVVFGASYNSLKKAVQEARKYDVLVHPFRIKIVEIKEGKTLASTRRDEKGPSASDILSKFNR